MVGQIVPGNQAGRGYPVFNPSRPGSTLNNEPVLLPDGTLGYPSGLPGGYNGKRVQRITVALDNPFTTAFSIAGSLIWFSGQNGGTAAPMYVTMNATVGDNTNDPIQMVYDRAISGVPFQQLIINNPTAQPGVTAEFTVVLDNPRDRVGVNG